MSDTATLTPATQKARAAQEKDLFDRVMKDPRELPDIGPGPGRTVRLLGMAIQIEQVVEARYLRVGRAFTYGPIRRLFEEYAAEVRDHARILSRGVGIEIDHQTAPVTRFPAPGGGGVGVPERDPPADPAVFGERLGRLRLDLDVGAEAAGIELRRLGRLA